MHEFPQVLPLLQTRQHSARPTRTRASYAAPSSRAAHRDKTARASAKRSSTRASSSRSPDRRRAETQASASSYFNSSTHSRSTCSFSGRASHRSATARRSQWVTEVAGAGERHRVHGAELEVDSIHALSRLRLTFEPKHVVPRHGRALRRRSIQRRLPPSIARNGQDTCGNVFPRPSKIEIGDEPINVSHAVAVAERVGRRAQ